MELWIRSKDKECLMKVDRLDYDLSNSKHRIMANGYQTLVAEYETKERALEVLDEIQEELRGTNILKYLNKNNGNMDNVFPILTYEMPKE